MESTKRWMSERNLAAGKGGVGGQTLSSPQLATAGAIAGLANGVVSGPVEHIRIRKLLEFEKLEEQLRDCRTRNFPGLQTQADKNRVYNGPWDAAKKIYASRGVAGIYKGQVATLWREGIGYGAYFLCYEDLMQRHMAKRNIKRDEVSPGYAVLFGAAAGYAVSPCLPLVCKTRADCCGLTLHSFGQLYTP